MGCDHIGKVWDGSISAGYPGSVRDSFCTVVTNMLDEIPFGCATEVDKRFLIDNYRAFIGTS